MIDKPELKWENETLAKVHVGDVGKPPQSVDVALEMSTKVGENYRGRPRLSVVLNVGNRFLRFDAENHGDGETVEVLSMVQMVSFAMTSIASDAGRGRFDDALAQWKASLPERPKYDRRDNGGKGAVSNDGGPNRGLNAVGKTARKKRARTNGGAAK